MLEKDFLKKFGFYALDILLMIGKELHDMRRLLKNSTG